jgi:CheY-like chemotaxis protein
MAIPKCLLLKIGPEVAISLHAQVAQCRENNMKSDKKTILFVEDNPLVLMIYRNWLQRDGFQVESAVDGQVALDKLLQLKPSLVLLDLMLPKVNGLDVLKFIREHPDLKTTPVMILSNAYMDEPASKAMLAGANKRMLKTQCTPSKLIEAVREALGTAPAARGTRPQNESALAEANEALLDETRRSLLADAPEEIAQIREHCLAFVKTAGLPASAEHLNNMYQQVRFLCARAGLGDCAKVAHLVGALEALLFEIISKKSLPSPSVLQTIAQAVDCLGRLFRKGDINSAEQVLKAKVLIADDDPICNFATMAAMKRAKLEAVCTQDPLELLEMAKVKTYDIVLLDINMPGLNGFEVCEKLRQLPQYKKTPVVFVTSNSEFQNRAQAVLSGGNDLIAKPIFPLELALKTIMHLIEPKEQARATRPKTETKAPTAPPPIVESVVEQITQQAKDDTQTAKDEIEMAELESADVPIPMRAAAEPKAAPVAVEPEAAPADDESEVPASGGDLNRVAARNGSAPNEDFPAPLAFRA